MVWAQRDGDKRRHGYSRDHRPDCVQVVIALIVTPEGLPLTYEVLAGITADCTTLPAFLEQIEARYGRAERVWVDRGTPTEAHLAEMRRREGRYLLRSNLSATDPAKLWQSYLQLVEVEAAFKDLKSELVIRPIFHQREDRIEAHIFVAFLAYCVQVTSSST